MLEKDLTGRYKRMQIRAHYRNQAWGPFWSLRKLIWIKPYFQNHFISTKYFRGQIITDRQDTVIDYILKKLTGFTGFKKKEQDEDFTILKDGRRIKSQETLQKIYNQSKDIAVGFQGRGNVRKYSKTMQRFIAESDKLDQEYADIQRENIEFFGTDFSDFDLMPPLVLL